MIEQKCPICGSKNLEEKTVEKMGKIIDNGLPRYFVHDGWIYYVCLNCFSKAKDRNWKGEFVCTFVDGQTYLWVSQSEIWLPIGKLCKELVQFT